LTKRRKNDKVSGENRNYKHLLYMKEIKNLIMAIGMMVMIFALAGCSKGNDNECPKNATTITDIECIGDDLYVFSLENGEFAKADEAWVSLYSKREYKGGRYFYKQKKYELKNTEEAFLWQMASVGDTVRPFKTEKGWFYQAPEKKIKITALTGDGIMLENGISVKLDAIMSNQISFYKNGYKIYSFRDMKVAFIWTYAQVGQEVLITEKPVPLNCMPKIASINELDGWRVYALSDGQEMWVDLDYQIRGVNKHVALKNREGKEVCCNYENPVYYRWLKATVGQEVELWPETGYIFGDIKGYTIVPVDLPDYRIERVVKTVSKYDGSMAKIDGSLHGSRGIFYGSVNGKIKGEAMSSEDFLINLFFEDRDPISVNAKENPLWLEIKDGSIVIEKRINGIVSYEPKF